MKPGEIWIVNIPELGGHEQDGTRPVVGGGKVSKTIVTIITLTSNKTALRFPFTISIKKDRHNGLSLDSIALIFHIRALDINFFKNKIGILDKKILTEIRKQAIKLIG